MQDEVIRLLDLDELRIALADAFRAFSRGESSVPPRMAALAPEGLLAAMPGYLPSAGLAVKLVSVFPQNHDRGLPGHQALIALFDPADGRPLALMDGTHITTSRTAGASAVAAQQLARPASKTLAILGAGVQGRSHFDAFARTFDLEEVRIASRNGAHAQALVDSIGRGDTSDATIRRTESFEDAVRGADIVCLCTDSPVPVIEYDWLSPGAHVGSVGFAAELDPETVKEATVFVEWRGAATQSPPAGARELQGLAPESVTEIGEVLEGVRPGRTSEDQITLYKSTGHAIEDAAAAALVFAKAAATRVGTLVEI
jgi:ornithine cyclodeaminase/alanine dehydrogenase-like protein (mu-crystallin family)